MQFKTEFNSSHALPFLWFGHTAPSLLDFASRERVSGFLVSNKVKI